MAEKEGFEPPVPLRVQLISSQSHSATLSLLLYDCAVEAVKISFDKLRLKTAKFSEEGRGQISLVFLLIFLRVCNSVV